MTSRRIIELFAGTGAISLAWAVGPLGVPLVAYMGSKGRYAQDILGVLGHRVGGGAHRGRVWLNDAGPPGEMWEVLQHPGYRGCVQARLRSWQARPEYCPVGLWHELSRQPPHGFPPYRVAQWLWLQARSASACPVWWDEQLGWRMGDKPRKAGKGQQKIQATPTDEAALRQTNLRQKGIGTPQHPELDEQGRARDIPCRRIYHRDKTTSLGVEGRSLEASDTPAQALTLVKTPRDGTDHLIGPRVTGGGSVRGMLHAATIAQRIADAAEAGFFDRLTVTRQRAERVQLPADMSNDDVILDPPYVGATGYAVDCARQEVLQLAEECRRRGARVVICEKQPLKLSGWHHVDITRTKHREWLTCSHPPVITPTAQQPLFSEAS